METITQTTQTEENSQNEEAQQKQQPQTPALFNEGEEERTISETSEVKETSQTNTATQLTAEDLTIPEGFTYEEDLGKSFLEILNDEKLSRKELGQKMLDMYHNQQLKVLESLKAADEEGMKKYEEDLAKEKADWLKACQADNEYGGQNWEGAQTVIDRGCKQLATPEAVALLQRYSLNTHPEIVRMFYRAGKLVGEDNSTNSGSGNGKKPDIAMAIFGESLKEYHKRKGENN